MHPTLAPMRRSSLVALGLVALACRPSSPASSRPSPPASTSEDAPARTAEAEELARLERMRTEDPREGPARYHLARWHARQGHRELALELLAELLAIDEWDYVLPAEDFPSLVDEPGFVAGRRFLYLADAFMQVGPAGMIPAAGRRHAILELPLD